ncbi:FAD-binding domain-containing protein [Paraphaeosphaeria sporulosa]|uniref:FAD-binding domain-containing protein n=1 Tax=Paraphaeosphaeria sporulosa TaxID=1460663 RepID=A0A177CCI4_9PLEO|nr:FAD-binding domain-containing protein [Paraphaeosphaeria sporulosa]OAG04488.1 FAD-binding domain-containing protein [Paraphaeosphaeria sporulosa]
MAQDLAPCCAQLSAIIGLDVALPNSSLYAATETAYWSIQEGSLAPSCIAKPSSSEHVASIIASIANQHDCPFAIKSQGHAPAAGFANINNGITIDLTALNAITTNKDASVAHIGTGASWLDVYAHLDTLNKTVAGGRNGGVGVGGLTLGGGISYFSPQAGFTCDTAINFEIVFAAFAKIAAAKPYDVHASITTSAIFNAVTKAWTLLSAPIYTKPQTDPEVYSELFAIPSISNTVQITQLHTLANETAMAQTNQLFSTGTYGVSAELLDSIFDICNETLYDFNVTGSLQWIVTFEPFPAVFAAQGAHDNILGTIPEVGDGMILLFSASWSDAAASSLVHAKNKEVLRKINAAAKHMGLLRSFVYANYAGTFQKPISSYGTQNSAFLCRVALKYDPLAVFQRQLPGGFKLAD